MPQSYLTRLLRVSAEPGEWGTAAHREELESISTDWGLLTSEADREAATWTITQVRRADGNVQAGPFKSLGRQAKRSIENTRAHERDWWIGPERLTDHSHIAAKRFPIDVRSECFLNGFRSDTGVRPNNGSQRVLQIRGTGNPITARDGIKTIACLHFQTTVKEEEPALGRTRHSPTEIIEIACALINRNTLRVVDEFHSYIRPQHVHDFSRLSCAITSIDMGRIQTRDGFTAVWQRLEEWLQLRNVLDSNNLCHEGNPTVFVVHKSDQLAALLPQQLRLSAAVLPSWLEDWIDLSVLFKRHFRCGTCSGCSTRTVGACRASFEVPHMLQVLRSAHWDEFVAKYMQKRGDDAAAEIDLQMYGVETECFESMQDQLHKNYVSKEEEVLSRIHGHLYTHRNYTRIVTAGTQIDTLRDWQLRMFTCDGYQLSFVNDETDRGVDFRLLKASSIVDVVPMRTHAQEFAFEIEFISDDSHCSDYVLLAAESAPDRARWIEGLHTIAALRNEKKSEGQHLAQKSDACALSSKTPACSTDNTLKSFLDSGHDRCCLPRGKSHVCHVRTDVALDILEEEQQAMDEMQLTLAELGIDPETASTCAQSGLSSVFESYRSGCSSPAAATLEYCRQIVIIMQALVTFGSIFLSLSLSPPLSFSLSIYLSASG